MTIEDFQAWQAEMPLVDLIEKARFYISENSKHYGKRWTMSIPPNRGDADMVFGELCRRLENQQDAIKEMRRMMAVIQHFENELPYEWSEATKGTGISTSNAYRAAIDRVTGKD